MKRKPETRTTSKHREPEERASVFLLWARREGFAVTRLHVSADELTVDVADFRIAETEGARAGAVKPVEPPKSVHDALADEFGLERPSDVAVDDNPEGED